ncbi:uncharacterized protein [Gossypium hirsutum]|uniref:Retrotransposon gag domain-containing protein n=1 Tax=Gossypium hirsutum TaxID=3635 RepID=A0A1U8NUQ7_GOSHI|nr:uncharacterized protein LOC107951983 [Gossypium hirsutum]
MPAREAPTSPATESGSHDRAARDDALSQAMLRVLKRAAGESTESIGWGSISEQLQSNGAKIFRGVSGVALNVAEYWLEATKRWWFTVREDAHVDRLTWDFFKAAFSGKYVGASYVDARKKEFLNLTQGNKIVAEYEVEFLRLSRYTRGIVATEYERCVWFEDGLRDELRVLIAPQREWEFVELVEKVKIAEDVKCSECQNSEKDRGRNKRDFRPLGSLGRPVKNCTQGFTQMQAVGQGCVQPVRGGQQPPRGQGQARGGNKFGGGREAPGRGAGNTEARQLALVCATCCREDGDDPDVITGMFLIYNLPYTVLIDIGFTHLYVACTVSETLGIQSENTVSEMTVLSLLRQSVGVSKLFRDVPLEVQGVVFSADFMELPFGEFDIILGMDWLVKHHAKLDCVAKRMVLKSTEDEEVTVIGERRDYLSNVISTLRAEKLVRKGCKAFLAHVSISNSKGPSVRDVRTVKEFLDVFLKELQGLPLDREVEFGIELLPGTGPVFIAPYKMARKELVELKAQI